MSNLYTPASVCILYDALSTPSASATNFARHLIPLPHISGSDPSLLKIRIEKSVSPWGGIAKMMPSPPTPKLTSHHRFASSDVTAGSSACRLSTCLQEYYSRHRRTTSQYFANQLDSARKTVQNNRKHTRMKLLPRPWYFSKATALHAVFLCMRCVRFCRVAGRLTTGAIALMHRK